MRKRKIIEIDGEQFRRDYLVMSQAELKTKYNITSTKLMQLVQEFVPRGEQYASRMRSGLLAAEVGATVSEPV